ncbi:hypothetical protein [Ralstonia solanacearum]|uniref:hypothetical protein n=1 Tax=Ralstonia solanacearum TaxID=305 RepID=UPI000A43B2D3|nr:hypothetical protein [Ralstonia solanacearum]MDC6177538.1 hypothetical protein [Ralstonia solanacearum]MDC6240921.1 hypothetical protein [Ralstonia solanacearum]
MTKKIYDGDCRRLILNQHLDGLRIDAYGVWPDDDKEDSAYSQDVVASLTGEEAAAVLERPDGWIPGQPYVRFPCTLEQLQHALGVYADAIDEDIAAEYCSEAPESKAKPDAKRSFIPSGSATNDANHYTCFVPEGAEYVKFADIAALLAQAKFPAQPEHEITFDNPDATDYERALARVKVEKEILPRALLDGRLTPMSLAGFPTPVNRSGGALPDDWIPMREFIALATALGVTVATEPPSSSTGSQPTLSDAIKDYLTVPIAALPPRLAERLKQRLDGIGVTHAQWDVAQPEQRARIVRAADTSAAEQAQYARQKQEKEAAGRYTLEEAANAIATSGERAEQMLEKLLAAAESGALPMYGPGESARYQYTTGKRARPYYEEAYWSDLNEWLAKHEPRIHLRFQDPQRPTDGPLTELPRAPTDQAKYIAARWNLSMHAEHWWDLESVTPEEAASLLYGVDPHDKQRDPSSATWPHETGLSEHAVILRTLEGAERIEPRHRALAQWLQIARDRGLKVHSWIGEWLTASGKGMRSTPPPSDATAEASQPSANAEDGGDWLVKVREIADELDLRDAAAGAWSSNKDISERIAPIAIERGIKGPHGQLTASNILRMALQGGRWTRPRKGPTS